MGLERLFGLRGKTALVTGGNSGIGLGYAEGLAEAGADVILWGRRAERNHAAAEQLRRHGGRVATRQVDVTDEAQVKAGFTAALAEFGRLDAVFANAGASTPAQPIETTPSDVFTKLMDLNVTSAFYTLREAAAHMVSRAQAGDPGGSLIVTGSLSSIGGLSGQSNYAASKHAVVGIARSIAVELGKYAVRVNVIAPGLIRTGLLENPDPVKAERIRSITAKIPVLRIGEITDFAGIAVLLASPASEYLSGAVIVIDGGRSASFV